MQIGQIPRLIHPERIFQSGAGRAKASGQTGPNLSHVGSKGADYIRESILDPNAVIAQPRPSGECAENVMPQSFGDVLPLWGSSMTWSPTCPACSKAPLATRRALPPQRQPVQRPPHC